jgi:hypothetical protein
MLDLRLNKGPGPALCFVRQMPPSSMRAFMPSVTPLCGAGMLVFQQAGQGRLRTIPPTRSASSAGGHAEVENFATFHGYGSCPGTLMISVLGRHRHMIRRNRLFYSSPRGKLLALYFLVLKFRPVGIIAASGVSSNTEAGIHEASTNSERK